MLTPILTVKTVTPSAVVAPVREPSAKEQTSPKQAGLSGQRSEAALRILETLNRHLVGSETLPKEALARLLETLSRLLKLQPLPQESLRDFGKRIAAAIEALPPAARLALEKQLGQRNLALSVRVLAEIVKALPLPEPARRPDTVPAAQQRSTADTGQSGPARGTPPQGAAQPLPQQQSRPTGAPVLPLVPPLQSAALAFAPGAFDAGALQAALRSAFNVDDEVQAGESEPTGIEDGVSEDPHHETVERSGRPASPMSSATRAGAGNEAMPTLRAVVGFLTSDPETLAHVIAIASGDMDEDLYAAVKQALDTDVPLDVVLSDKQTPQEPVTSPETLSATIPEPTSETPEFEAPFDMTALESEDAEYAPYEAGVDNGLIADDVPTSDIRRDIGNTDGEAEPAAAQDKAGEKLSRSEQPLSERTARTIADALKTLIEVGIPLTSDALNEPLEQVLAEFVLPEADDGRPASINGKPLATGTVPASDALADDFALMPDISGEPEATERDAARSANRAAINDDLQRDPPTQKMPEAFFPREAIPFLAMPVAIKNDQRQIIAQEEDEPKGFPEQEQESASDDDEKDGKQPGDDGFTGDSAASDPEQDHAAENEPADAYALYQRLGGFS